MNAARATPLRAAARRLAAKPLREGYRPEALHEYTDAAGALLFARIRLKHPDTGDKWIRPMKPVGDSFELGEPEFPSGKPLYRLAELGARPAEPVVVVEGEWCADALAHIGLLSTTSGGADSAERADWTPLAGRSVLVWPDNDEAGARYGQAVQGTATRLGCAVRTVNVGALDLPHRGDAFDWLRAHPDASSADVLALPTVAAVERPAAVDPPIHHPNAGGSPVSAGPDVAKSAPSVALSPADRERTIGRLAALSIVDYDQVRKNEADALGIRASILDKAVAARRRDKAEDDEMTFEEVGPWPDPVSPTLVLDDVAAAVRRFIVCQPETVDAVALWAAMTWFIDVVQVAPLAVITAPEKRCGKSQLLSLLGRISRRPLMASNISPAALFRSVDAWKPTLLVDEADAFMRDNDELRGLLNCGHTRDSAYIVRVVGDDHVPTRFNVWGAKALAGIGHLPDTIMDRAIALELRRRLPHEPVDRLRYAQPRLFAELASKLARFAADHRDTVRDARPLLPATLNDRAQDNWEPLLAIADVAGGAWPGLGRAAALKLSGADSPAMSTGTQLLADIRDAFGDRDRIGTADLIAALCTDDEKPWATYNRGARISPRQVARSLVEYGIKSKPLRVGSALCRGFERRQFDEAFSRYLAPAPVTALQRSADADLSVTDCAEATATPDANVTAKSASDGACYPVTDATTDAAASQHAVQRQWWLDD